MFVAVLVPLALGAALGWPAWSWLLLAVPLLCVPAVVARKIQLRVQQDRIWQPHDASPAQAEQHQAQQTRVSDVALPSAADDYDFYFSATAYWRPAVGSTMQHANLGGLAADAIVARAQTITAAEQPSRVDVVQHRLAGVLGVVQRDASGGVDTWAEQVELTIPEADQARLRKLSDARKDEDIWEHERNHERRKRAYLSDDVLKSTGSAVVWWLAQKDNDVEGAVPLIGALAQLAAAANDAGVPELFRHLVPDSALLDQPSFESHNSGQPFQNSPFHDASRQAAEFPRAWLPPGPFSDGRSAASQLGVLMDALDLGHEQRALFAHRFARLIEKAGKSKDAQEIRRRFDEPTANDEPPHISEPDDELSDRPEPAEQSPLTGTPWPNFPPSAESEPDEEPQANQQLRPKPFDELCD